MKKIIYVIDGMMCSHCEATVEGAARVEGVRKARAYNGKGILVVEMEDSVDTESLRSSIDATGYTVKEIRTDDSGLNKDGPKLKVSSFLMLIAALAIFLLVIKNTIGFNFIPSIPQNASFIFLFLAGVLTSLHCLTMCGGINLSQTINAAGESRARSIFPSFLYNSGRVVSYTIIGGLVGAAGSVLDFSPAAKSVILAIAGVFMLVMGLKIAGFLSFIKLPAFGAGFISSLQKGKNYSPFVVGLLNGLIPCAPLQAVQLYALGSGSAAAGALSMFFFSVGTFPLMFGIGALSGFFSRRFTSTMSRAGGVLVAFMAILMLSNSFALSGKVIGSTDTSSASSGTVDAGVQTVVSVVGPSSFQPVVVQKGIPVKMIFRVAESDLNGCNNAVIIPEFNIQKRLSVGDTVVEFTPEKSGTIGFSCWMGMIPGRIVVVDDLATAPKDELLNNDNQQFQQQAGGCPCCGGAGGGGFRQFNNR